MTASSTLLLVLVAGLGLGAIFFGGLWWSTRKGLVSRRPMAWFLGSFAVRTAIALAGVYLVAQGRWERLAACLLGFLLARLAAVRLSERHLPGGRRCG